MSSNRSAPAPEDLLRRWRTLAIPVEDAEHAAVRRSRMLVSLAATIRRSAEQRRGQRWRWRVVGAMAMAATVTAVVGTWHWIGSGEGRHGVDSTQTASQQAQDVSVHVESLAGTVVAKTAGGEQIVGAQEPVRLHDGDEVSTAPGGRAAVELAGEARIELSSATRVRVARMQLSEQQLTLRSGRIDVDVPEDGVKQKLTVQTPDAQVIVLGTAFSVALVPLADTERTATVVKVSRGHVRVIRRGGKSASLHAGQRWASDPLAEKPAECAGGDETASEPEGAKRATKDRSRTSATAASQLAQQNRMYRAALDARNSGRDEQALKLLDQFLGRYPESPLAQEAQVERFRTLKRLGRNREASRQARRYLAEHDAGFAREEARELTLSPE